MSFVVLLTRFAKSNEHSEYCYIGLADFFFQVKFLKFVHAQFFFRGLTCDLFSSSVRFHC